MNFCCASLQYQVSISTYNGPVLSWWKAIIKPDGSPLHWCIYASRGRRDFWSTCFDFNSYHIYKYIHAVIAIQIVLDTDFDGSYSSSTTWNYLKCLCLLFIFLQQKCTCCWLLLCPWWPKSNSWQWLHMRIMVFKITDSTGVSIACSG